MQRLKMFVNLLTMTAVLLPCLAYGNDSEWEEFLELKDQYYYLDKQKFNEISCVIETPLITDTIEHVKKQLTPIQEKVEIIENLSSFTLTYDQKNGLKFTDPEFDVILKNTEGLANPEKIQKELIIMKNGLNQQIAGVKNILTGLFDDYHYPKKESYKDLTVTENKEGYIVKYVGEDGKVVEKYIGKTTEISQTGNDTITDHIKKYLSTSNNKLILEEASAAIHQSAGDLKMVISVEYQDVGNIIFPKKIRTVFEQTIQSESQQGTLDINLKSCKIH